MRSNYTTVFFRAKFVVTNRDEIVSLNLEALYDDGFKVWINGTNVLNANISSGEVPFDGSAGPAREDGAYNTFALNSPQSYLVYRITATDSTGTTITVPYADDPPPDLAYFVYD